MRYVRCTWHDWYCYTPNGRLFRISNAAKLRRHRRVKDMRRSRHNLHRLGFKP